MNDRKSTAPDFFLNLGVVVTLYAAVISFLSLTFDVINKVFPDNLGYYSDPYSSGARFSMATLIIVFPLFVWLSRMVTKIIVGDPTRREAPVRRWLVYITLFLASVALVVDLVMLLNTFLSGEITARFILKVLAVLVVAGIVFWHYLAEVRGKSSEKRYQVAVYGSSILVIALLITTFGVFGSPATMRKLRADNIRVSNLQAIQSQIMYQWQQKGMIPDSLDALADPISGFSVPVDPETGTSFTYTKTGNTSFKLCGDFALATPEGSREYGVEYGYAYPGVTGSSNWKHDKGTVCFDRTIDPSLYPVTPVTKPDFRAL